MTEFLNDWGLILTIFLPLAGALVLMAIPKESEGTIKAVALGTALLVAGVPLEALAIGFSPCPNDTFMFHALVSGCSHLTSYSSFTVHVPVQSMPVTPPPKSIISLSMTSESPDRKSVV